MKNILVFYLTIILLNFSLIYAQSLPSIEVVHNQFYCGGPVSIVESAIISDSGSATNTLSEVHIQISVGYQRGSDILFYAGANSEITSEWFELSGKLVLSGTASIEAYEIAIAQVFFDTNETAFSSNRTISISLGGLSYLPLNGHYYQYVYEPGITWLEARDAAAETTYYGLQGYLVTVTSEEEMQLGIIQNDAFGWLGGSDVEQMGVWKWMTGPETGSVFWEGGASGSAPNNQYTNWDCQQPHNFSGVHYLGIVPPSRAGCDHNGDPNYHWTWENLTNIPGVEPEGPWYNRGYTIEYGGFEGEPEPGFSASSEIILPIVTFEGASSCGPETFDIAISGNADAYYWYESEFSDEVIFMGQSLTVFLSTSKTYWISPQFAGCTSSGRVPLEVVVNELPSTNDISVTQCVNAGDSPEVSIFNLSVYDHQLINGNPADFTVSHYTDEEFTNPIDSELYINQFNGQVIYARVTNNYTGCESLAEIELIISDNEPNIFSLEQCDYLPEDGLTQFDLLQVDDMIFTESNIGLITSYYQSYEEALLQANALPLDFTNTEANQQTIYVRLQDGNECLGINMVELNVRPLPELRPDETVIYCIDSPPGNTVTLDGGIINDIPNNYYYNWSTGDTTIAIEVNEPGIYTVEVSEVNGCSNIRTITVVASGVANIQDIDIIPEGDVSTVIVQATGISEYEYALGNVLGPYQESNVFNGIQSGITTAYVKDVKGNCGIEDITISVIGYPEFFTPNGDGDNDYWGLSGLNSEFRLKGEVKIFDRYGKLITVLTDTNPSWNGDYQGQKLPNSDYWFIAQLDNGSIIKGHFSLKR